MSGFSRTATTHPRHRGTESWCLVFCTAFVHSGGEPHGHGAEEIVDCGDVSRIRNELELRGVHGVRLPILRSADVRQHHGTLIEEGRQRSPGGQIESGEQVEPAACMPGRTGLSLFVQLATQRL